MKQKANQVKVNFDRKLNAFMFKAFNLVIKPFSHYSRRIFEFKHIKQALGILVVFAILTMAIFPHSLSAFQTRIDTQQAQLQVEVEIVSTPKSIRLPVDSFTLTQGYHFLHPAIDLAATKGSPVYTIMEGTVEEAKNNRLGYGNVVVINHGNGFRSLYAHLSKIEVKIGEKIEKDGLIGLVGSTGWSTGPHLHFQIWQDGKSVNPKSFIETYSGQKLVSTK